MQSVGKNTRILYSLKVKQNVVFSSSYRGKVPVKPTWDPLDTSKVPETAKIDADLVKHIERLALVNFASDEAVKRLASAVKFADQLRVVNTEGVEPMATVLEDWPLYLRQDEVREGGHPSSILSCAQRTEEGYFVAPPGNIPLQQDDNSSQDMKLQAEEDHS